MKRKSWIAVTLLLPVLALPPLHADMIYPKREKNEAGKYIIPAHVKVAIETKIHPLKILHREIFGRETVYFRGTVIGMKP